MKTLKAWITKPASLTEWKVSFAIVVGLDLFLIALIFYVLHKLMPLID